MNPTITRRGLALGAGVTMFSSIASGKGFSVQMQSTVRSAVAGAMGLNVFQRQADKLLMATSRRR